MTVLLRAIRVETLKLSHTLALSLSFVTPLVIVAFTLAVMLTRDQGTRIAGNRTAWDSLVLNLVYFLWGLVGLPLFIALETALLAGIEHQENTWKHLFVLPVPRWITYAAKLVIGYFLVVISSIILCLGVALEGLVLAILRPDLGLALPIPWIQLIQWTATFTVSAFLMVALQTWVAARWRSFTLPLGLGIVGTMVGLMTGITTRRSPFLAASLPWTEPFVSIAWPEVTTYAVVFALLAGAMIAAVGCRDIIWRDVA